MSEAIEKTRVNVTISNDILKWIDKNIDSRRFASRSHALEFAIMALKEADARRAEIDELIMGKLGGRKKDGPQIDLESLADVSNEAFYS